MELSENKVSGYVRRLLLARMRLLANNGFYGLLLMHMKFTLSEEVATASTDGERIYFNPEFMDKLNDEELELVLMHEILHVALQHCLRLGDKHGELFNIACDIVVNSNVMRSSGMDEKNITLENFGTLMHVAPDNSEGYEHTAEEVYEMLVSKADLGSRGRGKKSPNSAIIGKKSARGGNKNGGNGNAAVGGNAGGGGKGKGLGNDGLGGYGTWDDHSRWGTLGDDSFLKELWVKRFEDACEAISVRDAINGRGMLPAFAKRLYGQLKNPQTDWREMLIDFVQEEVTDYSFSPPDKRFDDSPFYLPDFNEKEDSAENVLFMIDTSGSMSDEMVTAAFSEIKGAIDQFNGKLKGYLGFFDAAIIEPKPFDGFDELKRIQPAGGGGTDFGVIFRYVKKYSSEKLPASIVILTDGYAPFPKEEESLGIPVLWLINNDVINPPWGKVARIKV